MRESGVSAEPASWPAALGSGGALQQPQAALPAPPPGGPAPPPAAWVSGCVGRAPRVMCGAPAGASLAGGHRCAQPGGCRVPPECPALPPCPCPLVTSVRPARCSPRENAGPGAAAPASPFDEGLVPFPLPPRACPCSGLSHEPACSRSGCIQGGCGLPRLLPALLQPGHPGVPVHLGVLSRAAEFSLGSCVCSPRSEPAQQPAPGAPEGGAPEGGAPEGAAPGGGPPGAPPNLSSNRRLQQTQAQVQEVSGSAGPAGLPCPPLPLLCSTAVPGSVAEGGPLVVTPKREIN